MANKFLVDFNHLIPCIEEFFVAMQKSKSYLKLNFLNAYNQLELLDDTQTFMTWSTNKGIHIVIRLPFGTKPACAKFQSVIKKVLLGAKGVNNF